MPLTSAPSQAPMPAGQGAPRILFVPVSGAYGMGEYARSLAIAHGVAARWPGAAVHFIVSRSAPYAAHVPYPCTLLASSPTFHTAAVIEVIEGWRPDVVIFDNAGRTAQLRAAQRSGARVVYISARRRQRRKAFRVRWMRRIDEHWIAYPAFIAGALSISERLKLRVLERPNVRYLDVILTAPRGAVGESIVERCGFAPHSYVLVVPGGGTSHPGAGDAVEQFHGAAQRLAAAGIATVFVGRAAAETPPPGACLRMFGALPQHELAQLMRGSRLIIANGGSTLLQSIACGKPCIAVPIAADQGERIGHCVAAGVAIEATLDADRMAGTAAALLHDEPLQDALAERSIALGLADGLEVALCALASLLPKSFG